MTDKPTSRPVPRPSKTLDRDEITIDSPADVGTALCELAWMQSEEKRVTAEMAARIDAIKRQYEGALTIAGGNGVEAVTFVDRAKALLSAVRTYCEQHKVELLREQKGKTRKFTHGVVKWASQRERINQAEGKALADTKAVITEKIGASKLVDIAKEIELKFKTDQGTTTISLYDLVNLEPSLQKSRILPLVQTGRLTPAVLEELHLAIGGGDDQLTIEVAEYHVQIESKNAL